MEEIPIKQYKPIEVWRCKGIEEGIKRCKKEQGRECWVYMEIQTDRMILDEEMKKMKEYRPDREFTKPAVFLVILCFALAVVVVSYAAGRGAGALYRATYEMLEKMVLKSLYL